MADEPFPRGLVPMMATASAGIPADESGWAFELKWDGVRVIAELDGGGGGIRLLSRNLNDVTARYPEVHAITEQCDGHTMVLDGEIVAFDDAGRPSFGRLQPRMHQTDKHQVAMRMVDTPVVYLLFDVLHLDGRSTRDLPWTDRRRVLDALELAGPNWQTPGAHLADGVGLLEASRAGGLEGVVAKRMTSTYEPGRRSREWLKVKNVRRQELVIGGWLPGGGNRTGRLGALLLGYHDTDHPGGLRFAGKVGTGFSDKELTRLGASLAPLELPAAQTPFVEHVPYRHARFVQPVLVAEIAFTEWTHTNTLRHPSYKGLRDDKPASAVVRET